MWEEIVKALWEVKYGEDWNSVMGQVTDTVVKCRPELEKQIRKLHETALSRNTTISVYIEQIKLLALFGE